MPAINWDDAKLGDAIDDKTPLGHAQWQRARTMRDKIFAQRRVLATSVSTQTLAPIHLDRALRAFAPTPNNVVTPAIAAQLLDDLITNTRRDQALQLHATVRLCVKSCKRLQLSEDAMRQVCALIVRKYTQARLAGGEAVGAVAAQSIGEPTTQMTLNHFHQAGIDSTLTFGVPRFKALIDLSHCVGAMSLSLASDCAHDRARATTFANSLVHTRLVDVVETTTLVFESDSVPDRTTVSNDERIVRLDALVLAEWHAGHKLGRWVARMHLHRERMARSALTPPEVIDKLSHGLGFASRGVHICCSETNALEWVVRVRLVDDDDKLALQRVHAELLESTLCGVRRISRTSCHEAQVSTAPGVVETQYMVHTNGMSVTSLAHCPHIDVYSTLLNDVHETLANFGLEAAAAVLFREIQLTITADGTHIDPRHMALVVDTMTFRGDLTSFTRHGINRVNQGPLLRASFEETVDVLSDAAQFNESDSGCGVTQSVIFGQTASVGSGMCSVRVNEVPRVEAPKPSSMMRKSRVRKLDAPSIAAPPRLEYVDTCTWKLSGNGERADEKSQTSGGGYRPPSPSRGGTGRSV